MLSIHNVEDINLLSKGQVPGFRWIELEIISREGISLLTLFMPDNSNAYRKVERLRELILDDTVSRPEDHPFSAEYNPLPRLLDPFAPLIREYANWESAQGFGDSMSAEDRLADLTITPAERAWLTDFCLRWDATFKSAGAKS